MNTINLLTPCEQMRLHCLSLIGSIRQGHAPHWMFHLRGIIRAAAQMLPPH